MRLPLILAVVLADRGAHALLPRPAPPRLKPGDEIVPLWTSLDGRQRMMAQGAYPGVDYIVENVVVSAQEEVEVSMRPSYRLIPKLERTWPVKVTLSDLDLVVSSRVHLVLVSAGAFATAVTPLLAALVVRTLASLYVIPTLSMEPTFVPRDVLPFEKLCLAARAPAALRSEPRPGEVVLFKSPPALTALVRDVGGEALPEDALFVKRVVCVADSVGNVIAGDTVIGGSDTARAVPERCRGLTPQNLWVEGDNPSRSTDSRAWGALPRELVVGRPVARIWPLGRVGMVRSTPAR